MCNFHPKEKRPHAWEQFYRMTIEHLGITRTKVSPTGLYTYPGIIDFERAKAKQREGVSSHP